MSLVQSRIKGPLGLKAYDGYTGKRKSEHGPRFLKSASFSHEHGLKNCPDYKGFTKHHGNATPQTPGHYHKRLTWTQSDLLTKPHPRPWSAGGAPGRKHMPENTNAHHWVWLTDMQRQGKWTRKEKTAYYAAQDEKMQKSMPQNEMNASRMPTNGVSLHWQALDKRGAKVSERPYSAPNKRLDITPPRQTGLHLKHGMYKGSWDSIKPYQYIMSGQKDEDTGKPLTVETDGREIVDLQLIDDNNCRAWREVKWGASANCDTFRPLHTDTCTTMGFYFTHR